MIVVDLLDHPLQGREAANWSVAVAVQTAFEALAVLIDRHKKVARKAEQKDLRRLYMRVAYAMPGALMGAQVEARAERDSPEVEALEALMTS
jgi:hypothetical protein